VLVCPVDVLVICGPTGVGKSSTAYEVAHLLAAANLPHAMTDCDELDRVHPWPQPGLAASGLSRRNLAAVWSNLAALGHVRLLLTGVFAVLSDDPAWITLAVPNANLTVIRPTADLPTLDSRIYGREIAPGADAQLGRALTQLGVIARGDPPGTVVIDTTNQTVSQTAAQTLEVWLNR
jgi:hypothetical protein